MYKKTLDAFGKFWEAYTKKEFSPYNEKEAFIELCDQMRIEAQKIEKNNEKAKKYVANKRKNNPTYARENSYKEKRNKKEV